MALLEIHIAGVTKNSITINSDLDYWDYPYYMELKVNSVSKGQFLSGELDYYPITGLTPGTSYLINVTAYEQDSDTYIEGASKTQSTTAVAYNPVSNLNIVESIPKTTHVTWTKPTVDPDATYTKYILRYRAPGIDNTIHVTNINSTFHSFSAWDAGCVTARIDINVDYGGNLSSQRTDSVMLGPSIYTETYPLQSPFSLDDLKYTMASAGDYPNLATFDEVNDLDYIGVHYTKLNRSLLATKLYDIEALSELEGYPANGPGEASPDAFTTAYTPRAISNLYSIDSIRRYKIKTTDITAGFWKNVGTCPAVDEAGSEHAVNSDYWVIITHNAGTSARTGYLQVYYESVPCSGNFDSLMPVVTSLGESVPGSKITITQSKENVPPPVDPGPGTPDNDSITEYQWFGNIGIQPPVIMPYAQVATSVSSSSLSSAFYGAGNDATPALVVNVKATTHLHSTAEDALLKNESIVKTGRLAIDLTTEYSNTYTQGTQWRPLPTQDSYSFVTVPQIAFQDNFVLPISFSSSKTSLYVDEYLKPAIDDHRIHLLTDMVETGAADSIWVPIYVGEEILNSMSTMAGYGTFTYHARVDTLKVKFLKLTLGPVHYGKTGISRVQRKVISYGEERTMDCLFIRGTTAPNYTGRWGFRLAWEGSTHSEWIPGPIYAW